MPITGEIDEDPFGDAGQNSPISHSVDRFLPDWDVREQHQILVRAPSPLVFEIAEHLDLQSILLVRTIFWLRSKLLRAEFVRMRSGLVEETKRLGWGVLSRTAGHRLIVGAVTQPWVGEVKFRALPPQDFAAFSEPGLVKIIWTLEAEPLGPEFSRFKTETRALATDDVARAKFKKYWRKFSPGIVLIRRLTVSAVRKEAERQYRVQVNAEKRKSDSSPD